MKRRLNVKGLVALISYILCYVLIISDMIQLLKGKTFTPTGIAYFIGIMVIGCIIEEYLRRLIERKN